MKGYFSWAERVSRGLKGSNESLDSKFGELMAGEFTYMDWKGPVLVDEDLLDAYLEKYYVFLRYVDELAQDVPEREAGDRGSRLF